MGLSCTCVFLHLLILITLAIHSLYMVPLYSNKKGYLIIKHTYWRIIQFLLEQIRTTQIQIRDRPPVGQKVSQSMDALNTGSEKNISTPMWLRCFIALWTWKSHRPYRGNTLYVCPKRSKFRKCLHLFVSKVKRKTTPQETSVSVFFLC